MRARAEQAEAALAAEQEKSRVLADEKKEAVRLGQLHWEDWDRAEKALAVEREKVDEWKQSAEEIRHLWEKAEAALASAEAARSRYIRELAAEREAHENETAHREAIHEEYVRACGQRDDAEAALARAEQERDHWRQEYKTLEGDIQRTVVAQRDDLKAALAAEREKHERTRIDRERIIGNLQTCNARLAEDVKRLSESWNEGHRIAVGEAEKRQQAQAALARAEALVRKCEWKATAFVIGNDSKTYVAAACPICRRPQPDGHTLDCVLAAHLRDREGGAA